MPRSTASGDTRSARLWTAGQPEVPDSRRQPETQPEPAETRCPSPIRDHRVLHRPSTARMAPPRVAPAPAMSGKLASVGSAASAVTPTLAVASAPGSAVTPGSASTAASTAGFPLNAQVTLVLGTGERVTGQLLVHDELKGVAVVAKASTASRGSATQTTSKSRNMDIRVVNLTTVRAVETEESGASAASASVAAATTAAVTTLLDFPVNAATINHELLVDRERKAVRRLDEQLARIGRGVSGEAQALFDALART